MVINKKIIRHHENFKEKRKDKRNQNSLDISEVNTYKYLGVNINQSSLLNNHLSYLKIKVDGIKRR